MSPSDLRPRPLSQRFRDALGSGRLDLPLPAGGSTPQRLAALAAIAASDLPLARLAEAHIDATAILAEAGRAPEQAGLYGVWASEGPGAMVTATPTASGLVLSGRKEFCTGAGLVDRALVTATAPAGGVLVDVDLRGAPITFDHHGWRAPAFAETGTATAQFDGVEVPASAVVGAPGFYLDRVGFWHGACAPAACWAGGTIGLIELALEVGRAKPSEPHRNAHLGALAAHRWQLHALLERAGAEADGEPADRAGAVTRAHALRYVVERVAMTVVDHVGRALGPRALAYDQAVIDRLAEVQLYVRQHHGERDLEALARTLGLAGGDPSSST